MYRPHTDSPELLAAAVLEGVLSDKMLSGPGSSS